jgi:hypothetical protein
MVGHDFLRVLLVLFATAGHTLSLSSPSAEMEARPHTIQLIA